MFGHVFINSRRWEVTAEEWGWCLEAGCVVTEERRYECRFSDKRERRERGGFTGSERKEWGRLRVGRTVGARL